MSFFSSKNKDKNKPPIANNQSAINTNAKIAFLEQEKQLLKITLDHILKENEDLKSQMEDMQLTVQHNKRQLKEYVDSITTKDKVVEKMNNTIEQLQNRLNMYEAFHKSKNKQELKNSNYNTFSVNDTYNDQINQVSTKINPSDMNFSYQNNQLNSSSVIDNQILKQENKYKTNYHKKQSKSTVLNNSGNLIQVNTANSNKENDNIKQINNKSSLNNSIINDSPFQAYGVPQIKIPNLNSSQFKDYKFVNSNNIYINKAEPEKIKEISSKQQEILEEILNLKNDIQFLMESAVISKSRIRDKKNHTIIDESNDRNIIHSQLKNNQSYMNSSINNMENINKTVVSTYNIADRTDSDRKIKHFQSFLEEYDMNKNILLIIDSQGNCWELLKRPDLSPEQVKSGENLISILNKEYEHYIISNKLLNIDIKDHDEEYNSSMIEVSRINDSIIN